MKISYRERDYAYGSAMLTLRTKIGLTQVELANYLGVSRRAVGEWEAGSSYPKAEHLKGVITLGVKQQAFTKESAVEEIRALWRATRQKVLLDERWLSALLSQEHSPHLHLVPKPTEESMIVGTAPNAYGTRHAGYSACSLVDSSPKPEPRVDWGDALAVPIFYGREQEQAQLTQWVVQERCRVVSVLGMGGIGKSALSVSIMYQVAKHFEVVIFRSLRDAPPCETFIDGCLQVLSPQLLSVSAGEQAQESGASPDPTFPTGRRISLLIEQLRMKRVLVILDNLECLLEVGDSRGHFRSGFEGYGQLLRRVAETTHQSCLLLTSREKPAELRPLEGKHSKVHSLRLTGLDVAACKQLCMEKELVRELRGHTWVVWGVGWSPDGKLVASCGWDKVMRLWNPTSGKCVRIFEDPATALLSVAWNPDGNLLAVATFLQGMYVWAVREGCCRWIGEQGQIAFVSAAWSPDGSLLAGGGDNGKLCLWESADGTLREKLPGHHGSVTSLAWSPDGTRLASGSCNRDSGELFVWDVLTRGGSSGLSMRIVVEHSGMVHTIAWSRSHGACPRGDQLISGDSDGKLRWWDVKTGECMRMREAHQGTVRSLRVSPDGKSLASCGDDGAIRIWDVESGEHLQTLRRDRPYERLNITGIRGLNKAEIASLQALGAIGTNDVS
jgi:WD40 repeat protein/transcriptional regulator with XRE-family HTH domain